MGARLKTHWGWLKQRWKRGERGSTALETLVAVILGAMMLLSAITMLTQILKVAQNTQLVQLEVLETTLMRLAANTSPANLIVSDSTIMFRWKTSYRDGTENASTLFWNDGTIYLDSGHRIASIAENITSVGYEVQDQVLKVDVAGQGWIWSRQFALSEELQGTIIDTDVIFAEFEETIAWLCARTNEQYVVSETNANGMQTTYFTPYGSTACYRLYMQDNNVMFDDGYNCVALLRNIKQLVLGAANNTLAISVLTQTGYEWSGLFALLLADAEPPGQFAEFEETVQWICAQTPNQNVTINTEPNGNHIAYFTPYKLADLYTLHLQGNKVRLAHGHTAVILTRHVKSMGIYLDGYALKIRLICQDGNIYERAFPLLVVMS